MHTFMFIAARSYPRPKARCSSSPMRGRPSGAFCPSIVPFAILNPAAIRLAIVLSRSGPSCRRDSSLLPLFLQRGASFQVPIFQLPLEYSNFSRGHGELPCLHLPAPLLHLILLPIHAVPLPRPVIILLSLFLFLFCFLFLLSHRPTLFGPPQLVHDLLATVAVPEDALQDLHIYPLVEVTLV